MGIIKRIKDWINNMIWENQASKEFGIELTTNTETEAFIDKCLAVYTGNPYWVSTDGDIKTINFAQTICEEVGKLACMNISVSITGSKRADFLQKQMDNITEELTDWVEKAGASGEIILKPNGESIDLYLPGQYKIVKEVGKDIKGIFFFNDYYNPNNRKYYTRLEYHRFDDNGKYIITNRCYVGDGKGQYQKSVDIDDTDWKGLEEEIIAEGVERMLFGLLKMPKANNIELDSNRRLPLFSGALEELSDLDVAYSRFATENYDSSRTVILDSDRLLAAGSKVSGGTKEALVKSYKLPRFVKAVEGQGNGDVYHEINPNLNTETRLQGINALLSQIGFKCGFSNGYFVFNEKTGMITATQVESDDRRTLNTILTVRTQLKACLDDLIYALDRFADAYDLAPRGTFEVAYDMEDLTKNHDEDRARWYSYVIQGQIPFWLYLTKFEGMTEEEAKSIAIQPQNELGLFAPEGA